MWGKKERGSIKGGQMFSRICALRKYRIGIIAVGISDN